MGAILVAGGAGFIGSHVVLALREAGREVLVLDDLSGGHADAVPSEILVRGDARSAAVLDAVFRRTPIDAVIHLAGVIEAGRSMVEPLSFYDLNVGTTVALTAAMVRHGVKRMVFSSSAAVYRPSENPLTEASPTGPQNPYGRTKLHSEEILRDACAAHGLSVTALRYFNAAGSDPEGRLGERHHPETHLIPIVLDVALGRRPRLDIFGTDYDTPDGTAVRDYIHVSDLARAHVDAIDHAATEDGFRAFNLGVGRGASVLEVLRAAERVVGRPIPHRFSPRRAGDPPRLVADPALALRRLRWLPAYPELETMIAHCWAFRQNLSVPSECLSV